MTKQNVGEKLIQDGAQKVTEKDVENVVNKSEEIQRKFSLGGPLQRFVEDGRLLISLVKDYWSGAYRQIPFGVIGAIVFTLIYVFNPLDLVPDVLPVIGQVDDAAVVAACLMFVEYDLRSYQQWKQKQDKRA